MKNLVLFTILVMQILRSEYSAAGSSALLQDLVSNWNKQKTIGEAVTVAKAYWPSLATEDFYKAMLSNQKFASFKNVKIELREPASFYFQGQSEPFLSYDPKRKIVTANEKTFSIKGLTCLY